MTGADAGWPRRYLLGALSEVELEQAEERLLREAGVVEELEQAEDELVEDFLQGSLGPEERRRFEDHFLISPRHRRQLQASRALREHVFARVEAPARGPSRALLLAAAALLVAALAAALWWSLRPPRPGTLPRSTTGTPLPRPEAPSPSAAAAALRLLPGQTLGPEGTRPQVEPPAAGEAVPLELVLEESGFESYQARLLTPEGEAWRAASLRPGGDVLRLDVPGRVLRPGTDYRVRLFGERDGRTEPVAGYSFRVSGPRHSPSSTKPAQ